MHGTYSLRLTSKTLKATPVIYNLMTYIWCVEARSVTSINILLLTQYSNQSYIHYFFYIYCIRNESIKTNSVTFIAILQLIQLILTFTYCCLFSKNCSFTSTTAALLLFLHLLQWKWKHTDQKWHFYSHFSTLFS